MSSKHVQITASLSQAVVDAIKEIAADKNVEPAAVIRMAVSLEKYMLDARKRGAKILIEEPHQPIKELLIG